MKKFTLKSFIIATLRRASYRYPGRTEALKAARIARNQYKCAHCGMIFGRKEIQIDHIKPIIDPAVGFVSWDSYIEGLFCEPDNLQVLDKICHKIKTDNERAQKKAERPRTSKKSRKKP